MRTVQVHGHGVSREFSGARGHGVWGLGSVGTGWAEISRFRGGNWRFLGQNWGDFGDGCWGKDGGKLDPPETKQIHGSNPTKHHQNQQITKKIGAIFGGEFSNLGRNQQTRLENKEGGSNFMRNRGS